MDKEMEIQGLSGAQDIQTFSVKGQLINIFGLAVSWLWNNDSVLLS